MKRDMRGRLFRWRTERLLALFFDRRQVRLREVCDAVRGEAGWTCRWLRDFERSGILRRPSFGVYELRTEPGERTVWRIKLPTRTEPRTVVITGSDDGLAWHWESETGDVWPGGSWLDLGGDLTRPILPGRRGPVSRRWLAGLRRVLGR